MDSTVEAIHGMARHLAAHGITGFLATTVSSSLSDTVAAASAVCQARAVPSDGASILGLHLEGPFLNPLRRGAHPRNCLRAPSPGDIDQVIGAAGDCVRLVTLAPELEGGLDLVTHLRRRGIIASMGHSDATYDQAMLALEAGVSHVTHVYNAMRPFNHREPGIIGVALTDHRPTVEIIADGIHVHPASVRLLARCRGPRAIVLVSDGIRGTGLPPGCYLMYGQEVHTTSGAARFADGSLVGSIITLDVALRNTISWTGLPLHRALAMSSLNQARELGLGRRKGSLAAGKDADLVICTPELKVLTTMVCGRVVHGEVT